MEKINNRIYVVVRLNKELTKESDFHIYTKQSSNKEKIEAYAKEIAKRHPWANVYLATREKARIEELKYYLRLLNNRRKLDPKEDTVEYIMRGRYKMTLENLLAKAIEEDEKRK